MKFPNSFVKFLEDEVNLNKGRLDRIKSGIETVEAFLRNNVLFKNRISDISPQGSVRQKTIIKPAKEHADFDVDLLCEMKFDSAWQPQDYCQKLDAEFRKTDRYKDIVDKRGKTRCVTLDYADDFHIDLVPSVVFQGREVITNRREKKFEATDADGYAQWFIGKNAQSSQDYLIKVCRLVKYLRDRKGIPIKSVLLTTILGNQVREADANVLTDLPTAFRVLLDRLDDFFQAQPRMPIITNPALASENFNRHWDDTQFLECKKTFRVLRTVTDDAYLEPDREKTIEKWRVLFGDNFPVSENDISDEVVPEVEFDLGQTFHRQPVTSLPGYRGEALDPKARIRIDGYLYNQSGKVKLRGINSGAKFGRNLMIRYLASVNVKEPYEVFWQVVNTGAQAQIDNGLRGDFFRAKTVSGQQNTNQLSNWERSKYKGKHWIEAFLLKDGYLVARSGQFFVNINSPV